VQQHALAIDASVAKSLDRLSGALDMADAGQQLAGA